MPRLTAASGSIGPVAGTAQILATVCVVMLFKQRNFAVGITFKKTEVIQTVLMGWIVLGEGVAGRVWRHCAGLVGLLLLSGGPRLTGLRLRDMRNRAAGLGIAVGRSVRISAVSYRGASLSVAVDDPLLRAGVTLAAVVADANGDHAVWLRLREPGKSPRSGRARRVAVWIGLTSMGGSLCWFIAFTLQNAAYVKALGQVELMLSIAASTLFFRERISRREWAGMAVLAVSILMLVLVT